MVPPLSLAAGSTPQPSTQTPPSTPVVPGTSAGVREVASDRVATILGPGVLVIVGLAYRATFLNQGFAGLDEGWLQTLGRRIAHGEVPYRDFNYTFPPLAAYKEAALIRLFGDQYGLLAARWVFSVEVAGASLLTYLVLRRFTTARASLLLALPTSFFSVVGFYFANYNYDGEFLLLVSVLVLVGAHPSSRRSALAGGVAGLAFLAKPTFLLFLPLSAVAMAVSPGWPESKAEVRQRLRNHVPFLAGFGTVFVAVFAALMTVGAGKAFLYQAFKLPADGAPKQLTTYLWQDLPSYFRPAHQHAAFQVFGIFALLALALIIRVRARESWLWRWLARGVGATTVICAAGLAMGSVRAASRAEGAHFLALALWTLLLANLAALVVGVVAVLPSVSPERRAHLSLLAIPPALPIFALTLQYIAQYTNEGSTIFYAGAFLSLPVSLVFLHRLIGVFLGYARDQQRARFVPAVTVVLVALWLAAGAIAIVRSTVYFDAPRSRLTAMFGSSKLAGVTSRPENVRQIDRLVEVIKASTKPDERILVIPELPALYFLADRNNATRQDWFDPRQMTPQIVDQLVLGLERQPPSLVLVQRYWSTDLDRSHPIEYNRIAKLNPIYRYVTANFSYVGVIDGIDVYATPGRSLKQ